MHICGVWNMQMVSYHESITMARAKRFWKVCWSGAGGFIEQFRTLSMLFLVTQDATHTDICFEINIMCMLPHHTEADERITQDLLTALWCGAEHTQQQGTLMVSMAQCQSTYMHLYGVSSVYLCSSKKPYAATYYLLRSILAVKTVLHSKSWREQPIQHSTPVLHWRTASS